MKKKFNPSAAIGYKRIKPLYDNAVSDLVEAERTIGHLQAQEVHWMATHNAWFEKVKQKDAKLKAADQMVGQLIRERDIQINTAMREIEYLRHTQSTLDKQLDTLRHVVATKKCASAKAEREKMAALADVQKLKSKVRNWAIIAGTGVGFAVAACAKVLMMGVV